MAAFSLCGIALIFVYFVCGAAAAVQIDNVFGHFFDGPVPAAVIGKRTAVLDEKILVEFVVIQSEQIVLRKV